MSGKRPPAVFASTPSCACFGSWRDGKSQYARGSRDDGESLNAVKAPSCRFPGSQVLLSIFPLQALFANSSPHQTLLPILLALLHIAAPTIGTPAPRAVLWTPAPVPAAASTAAPGTASCARSAPTTLLGRRSYKRVVDSDGLVEQLLAVGALDGGARIRDGGVFDQDVALACGVVVSLCLYKSGKERGKESTLHSTKRTLT